VESTGNFINWLRLVIIHFAIPFFFSAFFRSSGKGNPQHVS